jgi:NAD(P)H-hydrate epimerase
MDRVTAIPPAPDRPEDGHKGTFGTVIVVGGSATMMGAPALCAAAAFRAGAGLVKIATVAAALPTAIAIEPGATGIILGDDADASAASIDEADPEHVAVLAVGPGIGRLDAAAGLIGRLLRGRRTIVLDADGLNLLAKSGKVRPGGDDACPLVMTPHPGEYARLAEALGIRFSGTDREQRPDAAKALAEAHRAVVVLKGRHTVVCDGRRYFVNESGNVALATAGSGDVLTGLIAALIGQGMGPFDAATLGVYLHGVAADLWAAEHGRSGMSVRDLAGLLPDAFERHRRG